MRFQDLPGASEADGTPPPPIAAFILGALKPDPAPPDPELCYWCQTALGTTVDHLIPRSRGGSDDPENLVPCCGSCNSRKGPKTPDQYRAYLTDRRLAAFRDDEANNDERISPW